MIIKPRAVHSSSFCPNARWAWEEKIPCKLKAYCLSEHVIVCPSLYVKCLDFQPWENVNKNIPYLVFTREIVLYIPINSFYMLFCSNHVSYKWFTIPIFWDMAELCTSVLSTIWMNQESLARDGGHQTRRTHLTPHMHALAWKLQRLYPCIQCIRCRTVWLLSRTL